MSAIARTEDKRSESEVASEIGYSQSTERAIARSVTQALKAVLKRVRYNMSAETRAMFWLFVELL